MTTSSCSDTKPDAPIKCSVEPARTGSPKTDLSSAVTTPVKKRKIASKSGGEEASTPCQKPIKGKAKGEWNAQRRLKLWGAFNACADIKWDEVAAKVSSVFGSVRVDFEYHLGCSPRCMTCVVRSSVRLALLTPASHCQESG